MSNKKTVICIIGPTASGKTSLAVELALNIGGEIISADSMQIYKNIKIGTAKPSKEEMKNIPHYMLDIIDIEKNDTPFSVADFKKMAQMHIEDILSRNKVPIVVGGTGLYINSLINNIEFSEQKIDYKYREELELIAREKGNIEVHNILRNLDQIAAESIHPNNLKRVIRAIEICKSSNSTKTETDILATQNEVKYNYIIFGIDFTRDILYNRINKRVDMMLKEGLLEEAKYIKSLNLQPKSTVMQAIGYKELFDYIDNKENMIEACEKLKQATRNYAKRQLTWFKRNKDIIWLDGNDTTKEMVDVVKECI